MSWSWLAALVAFPWHLALRQRSESKFLFSHFFSGNYNRSVICYLSSLCLVAHKASTECLQFSLLAAAALASSHVRHPALFLSFWTVLRQVVLGLPLLLFPSGVHGRAMLVWLFLFRRRICPIIFHLLFLTITEGNENSYS